MQPTAPRLALLTAAALLIHGYHPYAEDGGMYLTGVKHFLHPALYPHDAAFVTVRQKYSLFDSIVGGFVRSSHRPLELTLLALHLLCIYLTLLAVARLSAHLFDAPEAPRFAAVLTAAALSVPVAGTSLFFFEPYLTARSFSTPLTLLAIACLAPQHVRSRGRSLVGWLGLLLSAAFHAGMAAYAAAFILLLQTNRLSSRPARVCTRAGLLAAAFLASLALQLHALPETASGLAAAHTRTYWFLSQWQWYEYCGLIGPVVIFALTLRYGARHLTAPGRAFLHACLLAGATATAISLSFARIGQTAYPVARLQPLREFHLLYGALLALLGSLLALVLRGRRGRAPFAYAVCTAVALAMFCAQLGSFPASHHVEFPGRIALNPWSSAFLWARNNTPPDTLFALDANYITRDDEDAQNFRAIAERSMLSDYSKDGGVAANFPALAPRWQTGSTATSGLSRMAPADRQGKLQTLGVTWLVLRSAATSLTQCPYDNGQIKVCPL